jgi:Tol biopolymer transport system component
MKIFVAGLTLGFLVIASGFDQGDVFPPFPGERHLTNIRKLTSIPGGENAEAYFSTSGDKLIFQSTRPPYDCDQIFTMDLLGNNVRMVSTGKGRTTCGYFLPGDQRILYASTHEAGAECPPKADMSQGYVWALYQGYDIYTSRIDGSDVRPLTRTPGYDAEATIAPDGSRIVFTSVRDGDLELYSMKLDGSDVRRLTHEKGYDGGAFFSPDSKQIVYRAHHPKEPQDLERYEKLLAQGLIEPRSLEIMLMNADGSNIREVTHNGKANFAPYFHPNGRQIIFASNMNDPKGRDFDLFLINPDGTGLEQVTFNETFDGFPMFNRDATRLVFCSNRHDSKPGETNVFIADWKP